MKNFIDIRSLDHDIRMNIRKEVKNILPHFIIVPSTWLLYAPRNCGAIGFFSKFCKNKLNWTSWIAINDKTIIQLMVSKSQKTISTKQSPKCSRISKCPLTFFPWALYKVGDLLFTLVLAVTIVYMAIDTQQYGSRRILFNCILQVR